jgi:hypothetical protein
MRPRAKAASGTQEILATISSVVNFGDSPTFVFEDFDTISSPQSFVSHLIEHIQQKNANVAKTSNDLQDKYQKLHTKAIELETTLKKLSI